VDCAISGRRAFWVVVALGFIASVAATIAWSTSMAAMRGTPMGAGVMDQMSAMRPSGATWLGMWLVMTPAMMLPSLGPALWQYREAATRSGVARAGRLTVVAGAGHLAVWTVAGIGVLLAGEAVRLAQRAMPVPARATPIAVALVVATMGAVQCSTWKARQLDHCRGRHEGHGVHRAGAWPAWRHGVRLGRDCVRCCANLMAILLVFGMMDLRAMAVVTAAITLERVAPSGARVARVTGALALVAGVVSFFLATRVA
jgi:predicted metal-binding membrane protein